MTFRLAVQVLVTGPTAYMTSVDRVRTDGIKFVLRNNPVVCHTQIGKVGMEEDQQGKLSCFNTMLERNYRGSIFIQEFLSSTTSDVCICNILSAFAKELRLMRPLLLTCFNFNPSMDK